MKPGVRTSTGRLFPRISDAASVDNEAVRRRKSSVRSSMSEAALTSSVADASPWSPSKAKQVRRRKKSKQGTKTASPVDGTPRKTVRKKRDSQGTDERQRSIFAYFPKAERDENVRKLDDRNVTMGRGQKQRKFEDDFERRGDSLERQFSRGDGATTPDEAETVSFKAGDSVEANLRHDDDQIDYAVAGLVRRMSMEPSPSRGPLGDSETLEQGKCMETVPPDLRNYRPRREPMGNVEEPVSAMQIGSNSRRRIKLHVPIESGGMLEDQESTMSEGQSRRRSNFDEAAEPPKEKFSSEDDDDHAPSRRGRRRISLFADSDSDSDDCHSKQPTSAVNTVTPTPFIRRSGRERGTIDRLNPGPTPSSFDFLSSVTPATGKRWGASRPDSAVGAGRPRLADLVQEKAAIDRMKNANEQLRAEIEQMSQDSRGSMIASDLSVAIEVDNLRKSGLNMAQIELKVQTYCPESLFDSRDRLLEGDRQINNLNTSVYSTLNTSQGKSAHLLWQAIRIASSDTPASRSTGAKREAPRGNATSHRNALVCLPSPSQAMLLCNPEPCPGSLLRWLTEVAVAEEIIQGQEPPETTKEAYMIVETLAKARLWNAKDEGGLWLILFCRHLFSMGGRLSSSYFSDCSVKDDVKEMWNDDTFSFSSPEERTLEGQQAVGRSNKLAVNPKFPHSRLRTLLRCLTFAVELTHWCFEDLRALSKVNLRIGLSPVGSRTAGSEAMVLHRGIMNKIDKLHNRTELCSRLAQDFVGLSSRLGTQRELVRWLTPVGTLSSEMIASEAAFTILQQWCVGPTREPECVHTSQVPSGSSCNLELLLSQIEAIPPVDPDSNLFWLVSVATLVRMTISPLVVRLNTEAEGQKRQDLFARLRDRVSRLRRQLLEFASADAANAALGLTVAVRTLEVLGEPEHACSQPKKQKVLAFS